ncbi:hypothetical protein [Pseudomonas sp. MWU13-3659]|uniref:hypothetical protein n=1 Tax=Pseudomonas sp. MWU13-3659 TaxID=2986964 RepID=UPI0020752A3E|nr:hypothetical protein [Pseudomonas sp. MWU13-3659]
MKTYAEVYVSDLRVRDLILLRDALQNIHDCNQVRCKQRHAITATHYFVLTVTRPEQMLAERYIQVLAAAIGVGALRPAKRSEFHRVLIVSDIENHDFSLCIEQKPQCVLAFFPLGTGSIA